LLWVGVIFFLSSQPAEVSNRFSKSVAEAVYRVVVDVLPGEPGFGVSEFNAVVRKAAHFLVYFVLALLLAGALAGSGAAGFRAVLAAFLVCIVIAVADEMYQAFVPGRGGQVGDVLINGGGALTALIAYYGLRSKI
jgi:VanZ family protein